MKSPKKPNPFDPALHGGTKLDHPPITEYAPARPRAARVRWKLKGAADGPVYEGQKLYQPCPGCAKPAPPPRPPA